MEEVADPKVKTFKRRVRRKLLRSRNPVFLSQPLTISSSPTDPTPPPATDPTPPPIVEQPPPPPSKPIPSTSSNPPPSTSQPDAQLPTSTSYETLWKSISHKWKQRYLVYYQAKEAAHSQGLHSNITVHEFLHLAASKKFVPLNSTLRNERDQRDEEKRDATTAVVVATGDDTGGWRVPQRRRWWMSPFSSSSSASIGDAERGERERVERLKGGCGSGERGRWCGIPVREGIGTHAHVCGASSGDAHGGVVRQRGKRRGKGQRRKGRSRNPPKRERRGRKKSKGLIPHTRSRGHLLRLLCRPRKGDPRRCSSVDILAREIPGGFLRCSSVGRCSSVDILAREIPRRLESSSRCAEATATPFPSFLGPLSLSRSRLSLSDWLSLSLSSGLLPSHQSSLSFFTGSHPLPLLSRHCYCVNWVAVTAPPIPTVLTLRNPGHRDCRLRLFAAPLVSLLSMETATINLNPI
ncbi:hypothetical protein Taro_000572 [Colocasia esculenta]|uniref:Uncharacterized protein n=1 Tax=Colocasia esculenta TaxID=4460 RepID=A0A843T8A7_COLES|nr:hypothetical protein [Colocasia esculenta]